MATRAPPGPHLVTGQTACGIRLSFWRGGYPYDEWPVEPSGSDTVEPETKKLSLKSATLIVCGLVGLLWLGLTLLALAWSIVGGDPLYTAYPGGLVLPSLSLFGKVYLISSMVMPFIVIGAIASA